MSARVPQSRSSPGRPPTRGSSVPSAPSRMTARPSAIRSAVRAYAGEAVVCGASAMWTGAYLRSRCPLSPGQPRPVLLLRDPTNRIAHAFLDLVGSAAGPEPMLGTRLLRPAALAVEALRP